MSYHVESVCRAQGPSYCRKTLVSCFFANLSISFRYYRGQMYWYSEAFASEGGKQAWPELLGKKAREAKDVILKENTYVDAVVYTPQDAIVTDDFCCNRVRIFVNCHTCDYENAAVIQIPRVGWLTSYVAGDCICVVRSERRWTIVHVMKTKYHINKTFSISLYSRDSKHLCYSYKMHSSIYIDCPNYWTII